MSKAPSITEMKARGKVSGLVKSGVSLPKFETREEAESRKKAQTTHTTTPPHTPQNDSAPQADITNTTPQHTPTLVSVPAGIDPEALARSREKYPSLQANENDQVVMIPIDLIDQGRHQNRHNFSQEAIETLAEGIRVDGLMKAIDVRPMPNGRYELLAGERRLRAHKLIGAAEIKSIVHYIDEVKAVRFTILENISREDLSDWERYFGIKKLRDEGESRTVRALATDTGWSVTQVQRLLSYEKLPAVVQQTLKGNPLVLGAAAAQKLALHTEAGHAALVIEAFEKIVNKELTETRADNWIHNRINPSHRTRSERVIATNKGRSFATIVRDQSDINIKIGAGVDMQRIEELLYEALQSEVGKSGGQE
jgi:ParB family chromosome partitioning protein